MAGTNMQYRNDKNGQPISVLGYGCMRFTKNGRNIDFDKAEKELMKAYELGVNYFDTAYIYTGSEALLGEVFGKNQIRDKINIATIDANASDFEALSIEDQRRFLIECLDKNMLYVNLCDLDDEEFAISDEEKAFNRSFYGLEE